MPPREPFDTHERSPAFAAAMRRAEGAVDPPKPHRYRRGTFGVVDMTENRILSTREAATIDPELIQP